jgi:hypothetical protein
MKNTLVVNVYGGPGSGKSSMMHSIMSTLKWKGVDCEMAPEYAKDLVWDNSYTTLKNQFLIAANQYTRVLRLNGKVDVIVTDSPLLLGLYYGKYEPDSFKQYLLDKFNEFDNINFFIKRVKPYNQTGRTQSEDEAIEIDDYILKYMIPLCKQCTVYDGTLDNVSEIIYMIEQKLNFINR